MSVREICHIPDIQRALKCSRWKVWNLTKTDSDFPKPRMIAGKCAWFADEVNHYIDTRPQSDYGAGRNRAV